MAGLDLDADQHPSTQAAIRDLVVLERFTIDDGNTEALWDGDQEYAFLLVINEDTDATGLFTTDGSGNAVTNVSGANWGASSTASNNNLFNDGNNEYVIENNTGTDGQTYTAVGLREV